MTTDTPPEGSTLEPHIIQPAYAPAIEAVALLDGQTYDIPVTWQFSPPNLRNQEQMLHAMEVAVHAFVGKWQNEDLSSDPATLALMLDELNTLTEAGLIPVIEGRDPAILPGTYHIQLLGKYADMQNKPASTAISVAESRSAPVEVAVKGLLTRITKIPQATLEQFLAAPELADYRHFIELLIAEGPFRLGHEAESAISDLSASAYRDWYTAMAELLAERQAVIPFSATELEKISGTPAEKLLGKPMTIGELFSLGRHPNRTVRLASGRAIVEILTAQAPLAVPEMNALMGYRRAIQANRGYKRVDHETAVRNDIPLTMVDALSTAVTERYDITRRLYDLKAKLLGLEKIHHDERGAPVGEVTKTYTFQEAVTLISGVLKNIDPNMLAEWENCLKEGRIDLLPRKNKWSGAFSLSETSVGSQFMLMNWTGTLQDVLTLAHEFGHYYNDKQVAAHEKALNASVPTVMAEVASIFTEDQIMVALLATITEPKERLSFMVNALDGVALALFRQIAVYEFEMAMHEEFQRTGKLTFEKMCQLYLNNLERYMGGSVELGGSAPLVWIATPHIRDFFYTYGYPIGMIIGKAMGRMLKEDPANLAKVQQFFRTGRSKAPVEIMAELGIDILDPNFWKLGLNQIDDMLKEAEELAKQLGY